MWLTDHVWLCCQASSGGQSGSSASTPPRYTIYVVEGSPHKASDLRRAGLERASAVVVLADKAAVQDIDEEVRTRQESYPACQAKFPVVGRLAAPSAVRDRVEPRRLARCLTRT